MPTYHTGQNTRPEEDIFNCIHNGGEVMVESMYLAEELAEIVFVKLQTTEVLSFINILFYDKIGGSVLADAYTDYLRKVIAIQTQMYKNK